MNNIKITFFNLVALLFTAHGAQAMDFNQLQQAAVLHSKKVEKHSKHFMIKSAPEAEMPLHKKMIELTCADGGKALTLSQASQFEVLQAYFNFDHKGNYTFDLNEYSAQDLHNLLELMQQKNLNAFSDHQIENMMQLADYLQAPTEIRHMLADYCLGNDIVMNHKNILCANLNRTLLKV